MAGNRRRGGWRRQVELGLAPFAGLVRVVRRQARSWVEPLVVLAIIAGVAAVGWSAAHRSAYFRVQTVEVAETPHLSRQRVLEIVGLDGPRNTLAFDPVIAEQALRAEPWVARAAVRTRLPGTVEIEIEERRAAGAVLLDALYLVDADGKPFVDIRAAEVGALTVVTGLSRETFGADPEAAWSRIKEALALARAYEARPIAIKRPLSDVYLCPSGRMEIVVGRTRVVIGSSRINEELDRLEQIVSTLEKRSVDALYVLLDENGSRAVVKEIDISKDAREPVSLRRGG